MENLKNKKVIGIIIVLILMVSISLLTYGRNRENVFKDEYMQSIFIDEDSINAEENINIDYLQSNTERNNKVDNDILEGNSNSKIVVEIKGEVKKIGVVPIPWASVIYSIDGSSERLAEINPSAMKAYEGSLLQILDPNFANISTKNIGSDP